MRPTSLLPCLVAPLAALLLGCDPPPPVAPGQPVPYGYAGQPAPVAIPQPVGDPRILAVEQRARIAERMAELRVPGVSVAVIEGGAVVWAKGYGVLDINGPARVTPDTLFQAASISKPVTAMVAMKLVESGRLPLDEDVNHVLRSWKLTATPEASGRPATLRMLLSHSGGTTVHGFRGYAQGEPVPSLLDVLDGRPPANSGRIFIESTPGEKYSYSGGGLIVVQALMQEVERQPFDAIMRHYLLEPLGMVHSTYTQPLPMNYASNAATGHRSDGSPLRGHWYTYPEQAAAGLWTTPSELARVVLEMQAAMAGRGRVVSRQTAALMLTRQSGNQGLGFALRGRGDRLRFSHGGSNTGFKAHIEGVLQTGQGLVVMTNGDNGGKIGHDIVEAIAAVYGWPDTKEPEIAESETDGDEDANDERVAVLDTDED